MTARLHHEPIGTGPHRMLLTHGMFGAGSNWRGIARKVIAQRPEWTIELVDLRNHGRSESGEGPHTVAAAADDVRVLCTELGDVAVIAGHSFGGKVVLAARPHLPNLAQTWMLDSSPSPRPDLKQDDESAVAVLELMERLPRTWATRDAFVSAIVNAGHDVGLAQWLAMNVVADGDAYKLRLDLAALHAMIDDYCEQDLWSIVEAPRPGTVEMVIADRSSTVSAADRERLAHMPPHVHVHHIDAGHWLHIDAPANVVGLLVQGLPTTLS